MTTFICFIFKGSVFETLSEVRSNQNCRCIHWCKNVLEKFRRGLSSNFLTGSHSWKLLSLWACLTRCPPMWEKIFCLKNVGKLLKFCSNPPESSKGKHWEITHYCRPLWTASRWMAGQWERWPSEEDCLSSFKKYNSIHNRSNIKILKTAPASSSMLIIHLKLGLLKYNFY